VEGVQVEGIFDGDLQGTDEKVQGCKGARCKGAVPGAG
jgi:hypothetical protein